MMKQKEAEISEYRSRLIYWVSKTPVYILLKIFWRLRIEGHHHIPKTGAVILAPNHRSYADPPVMGASVRRPVHFLAKKELFSSPFFGWLISNQNAHPMDRRQSIGAMKMARKLLERGLVLVMFPEGKRSKIDDLLPVKPGVGMLAFKSGAAVVPVYIHNTAHMKRFRKIVVKFGAPLYPKRFRDYDALSDAIMTAIKDMKEEVTSGHAS